MNYFSLFGLPVDYALDEAQLERTYLELQRAFHPDRFATKPQAEKLAALTKASTINDGYEILKSPRKRAEYLLSLENIFVNGERDNRKPNADLLVESMEQREALAEANSLEEIHALVTANEKNIQATFAALEKNFAQKNSETAAMATMRLRYLEKFADEIRLKQRNMRAA